MFIGHIGIIASSQSQESIPYVLWDFTSTPSGTLNDVNLGFLSPADNVQIDWGDGSTPEDITSGVNYNHTFA
jgi:hypothetical protein